MNFLRIFFKPKPPNVEELKSKGEIKRLIKALTYYKDEEGDWRVRKAAALALGELKDASAVNPLIVQLNGRGEVTPKAAAHALGELKDARAVEPLITALNDKKSDVVTAVLAWGPP